MSAILPPHVDLREFLALNCALGTRFRDTVTNQVVRSGLQVKAYPEGAPESARPVLGQVNPSGVWLFYGLPDTRAFELGTGKLSQRASPPGSPRYRITVEDEESRFLPCTFLAAASDKGPLVFSSEFSSPPGGTDVPLFSAPSRAVPSACAVIRTTLIAPRAEKPLYPASWALLQARTTVRGQTIRARGLSNERGDVALMFPWPELVGLTAATSPPGGLHVESQGWDFEFSVWHVLAKDSARWADLDAVFIRSAGPADRLETADSPPTPFTHARLTYGRELLIPEDPGFSPPASDPGARSHILIVKH